MIYIYIEIDLKALIGFEHRIKQLDESELVLKRTGITPPGIVFELNY